MTKEQGFLALERLSAELATITARLNRFQFNLKKAEDELAYLQVIESSLVENIRTMKSASGIVSATEFKHAHTSLDACKKRQKFLGDDIGVMSKSIERMHSLIINTTKEYDLQFEKIHNPPSNVIRVDFGRKDG